MLTALDNIADAIENGSQGSGGSTGIMIVRSIYSEANDGFMLNYTWQEIHDAISNYIPVIIIQNSVWGSFVYSNLIVTEDPGVNYQIIVEDISSGEVNKSIFVCDNSDDYPIYS